jgi:predicted DCC family thiol-disulfide oxidoreductase YuxK
VEIILIIPLVCNMCNGFANFVIARDKNSKYKFASLQSKIGRSYIEKFELPTEIQSIVLIEDNQCYMKSTAVLKILYDLKFPWWGLYSGIFVPRIIRDFVYNIVANYRYTVFGKSDECSYNPRWKDRFLLDGDEQQC